MIINPVKVAGGLYALSCVVFFTASWARANRYEAMANLTKWFDAEA